MIKINDFSRDDLVSLYVIEGKSMYQVAKELGIAVGTVFNYLKKFGIETREPWKGMKGKTQTPEARAKISAANRGKKVSAETLKRMSEAQKRGGIGHKKRRADGYIAVYFPDHPHSGKEGYVMEHVLVMEALIGRHLAPDECVHHINEIRSDNRKENLALMTKSEHMAHHSKKRWAKIKGE